MVGKYVFVLDYIFKDGKVDWLDDNEGGDYCDDLCVFVVFIQLVVDCDQS